MSSSTSTSRRPLRLITGVIAGLTLAVGAPLAASAHVHVTPGEASAGVTENLVFSFSHGCDDAATTSLTVEIPDGVTNVVPVADANWTIEREVGGNGAVTSVTFAAREPIENGLKGTVALDARFDATLADTSVAFPVVQTCTEGSYEWTQVAADGQDPHDLDTPAPVVAVGAVADGDDHDHGSSSGAGEHEHEDSSDAAAQASDTSAAADTSDAVARWLAGGALTAGILALVVALVAAFRRRS